MVISKVPHDLFRLDPLRNFYARRPADLRVLLMLRDPRDLLTARRPKTGLGRGGCGRHTGAADAPTDDYCLSPAQWRQYWVAFDDNRRRPDAQVVRYESLVADVAAEQGRVEAFVGHVMAVPFADAVRVSRPDFDAVTLRGRRDVEGSRVARWRDPRHAGRVSAVLADLPELPAVLVMLGYEPDAAWADAYR